MPLADFMLMAKKCFQKEEEILREQEVKEAAKKQEEFDRITKEYIKVPDKMRTLLKNQIKDITDILYEQYHFLKHENGNMTSSLNVLTTNKMYYVFYCSSFGSEFVLHEFGDEQILTDWQYNAVYDLLKSNLQIPQEIEK